MQHATLYDVFFHPFPVCVYISIVLMCFIRKMYIYYKNVVNRRGRLWFYSEDFFYCLPIAGFLLIFSLAGFLVDCAADYDFQKMDENELNLCKILLVLSLVTYVFNILKYKYLISIFVLKIFASVFIGSCIVFLTIASICPVWILVIKKYINSRYCEYIFIVFSLLSNYMMFVEGVISGNIIKKVLKYFFLGISNITVLSCVYIVLDRVFLECALDVVYVNVIITILCGILYFYMEILTLKAVKNIYGSFRVILYALLYGVFVAALLKMLSLYDII